MCQRAENDFDHHVVLLRVLIVFIERFRSFAFDDDQEFEQTSNGVLFAQLRNDRRRQGQILDQTDRRFDDAPMFFDVLIAQEFDDVANAV